MVLYAFVWEKGKTTDFSETIVVYDLKLATDDQSDKKFPLTSILCPLGAVTPRKYWLITQEAIAPSQYDWKIVDWDVKPQHNQPTLGAVCPLPRGYIHVLHHEKNCIKPDMKEISLKLETNG